MEKALDLVNFWLGMPGVIVLQPGVRHYGILRQLLPEQGVGGPIVTDVILAALAMENGATLASTDKDFARLKNLRWVYPAAKETERTPH